MSRWQVNTEKLANHQGAWYFYTNVWYVEAPDLATAQSIGYSILQAERQLMMAPDGWSETYGIGTRLQGSTSPPAMVYYIQPGLWTQTWGTLQAPAELVVRVTFPIVGGRGGVKWYRPPFAWGVWDRGPLERTAARQYSRYVAGINAVRASLYLPNGVALPSPASAMQYTHYRLRHGTKRQSRPVYG